MGILSALIGPATALAGKFIQDKQGRSPRKLVSGIVAAALWLCVCSGVDGKLSYISDLRWLWVYDPAS